jgi:hypothetical protein
MGRALKPEVSQSGSGTCAKTAKSAKTPHTLHFGTAAAKQDKPKRVNVPAGVRQS